MTDSSMKFLHWIAVPMAVLLSAVLLAVAFPEPGWHEAAWFGLVPLWLLCRFMTPRRAVLCGFLCGTLFFLVTLHWLTRVTVWGWIGLSLYCAVYFIPFTVFVARWNRRYGTARPSLNLLQMIFAAAIWAGAEYLRGSVFTGFPWNALGVSQYANPVMIQLAAEGGVPLISALLVLMNGGVALTLLRYAEGHAFRRRLPHAEISLALLLVALTFACGMLRLMRPAFGPQQAVRVALVQPAIPQTEKWTPEHEEKIYRRLESLSLYPARPGMADLIVWPETALPDFALTGMRSMQVIRTVTGHGVPLLAGSMDVQWTDEGPLYFNSSLLFDAEGELLQKYDKQHLVLFGEYVPLADSLPFLKVLTPIQASFTAGSGPEVFTRLDGVPPFAALICFEDTLAPLARRAVRAGARWLVNQTNDAWFDPSAEPRQHLAHCVFRAVENRVPVVRAANTGVSAVIDPYGRIVQTVRDAAGNESGPGFLTAEIQVALDAAPTFYTRRGDWVSGLLLLLSVGGWIAATDIKKLF